MKRCPCCGYKTLEENSVYNICDICFWEDDIIQFEYPEYRGGANSISLKEAQRNFIEFGAYDKMYLNNVRSPDKYDLRDENWRLL